MNNPTIDEHHVPQYIIKNFANKKNLVCVADISTAPCRFFMQTPANILFRKNLYETKNIDGTFFQRNSIEHQYRDIEAISYLHIPDIISRVEHGQALSEFDDSILFLATVLQLVRTPRVKKFLESNNDDLKGTSDGDLVFNAIYRILISSAQSGFDYLETNDFSLSPEAKAEIIQKMNNENSALDVVLNFLMKECYTYIVRAEESMFLMADEPVLIHKFPDIKYLYPISPKYAIACSVFESESKLQSKFFMPIFKEGVRKVNLQTIKNAERFIVFNEAVQKEALELINSTIEKE